MLKRWMLVVLALGLFLVACGGDTAQVIEDAAEQVGEVAEQVADNAEEIAEQAEEAVEQAVEVVAEVVEELSCDDAIGCVEIAAGDPIKLASALVVTGPNESLGLDSQYGVEIAIADRGELFGHEITLQAEDDGCSAEGGQTAGQKIVSDPSIVGVIGTSCSGAGVPMSQIVCDAGVVMVSPSNTAPVLTGEDTRQSCYFRTAHNDKIQGKAMADFVFNELGITKAAAIHDGDPYTEGLASVFRDSFTENGGEIVAFEAEASDATNVEPLLTSVAAAGPELIYYPVFIPLGSLLTKTAQEIDGLDGVILAAADGVLSPDFIEAAGDASEGMYMSGPDLGFGNDIYTSFLATYESEYGTEPTAPFHAHAYDATNMVLNAIESIAQIDTDGNMLIGRQALIDAVGATSGMSGITGTLTCDAHGDCADARIAVNQIQSGEFVPVASAADTMQAGDGNFSVCQVTDVGGIDDKSFNATAWVGAEAVAAELGGEAKFLESQQQTDYERNINAFMDEGCDLIVTVGFLLGDATAAAAEANPDQKFSIIDFAYDPTFDNVVGQIYAIDQAAFLAGYVAAATTETGIVGTFGGINIPPVTQFMDGYVMGVNYHNDTQGTAVEVLGWDIDAQDGLFTGNFESTDDGRTLGESLLDEGADVILPVAGPVGLGTAAAVQERGNAWIVGVDTDWTQSASEFSDVILTSIMKRMDVSVMEVSKLAASGDFAGGVYVSTLENGGVSITDGAYDVDIQPLIDGIIAGEIATAPGQEVMNSADLTPVKVCEVTDVGGIDDKSFNATAWVGAQAAAEATGGTAQYLESQQQTDYERNIGAFIDEGCDLIVGVGFLLGDAIAVAAEANPDSNFTIIDFAYDPTIPNVVGQVYASNQPAFLAGMVAADTTETGIVGVYGGINIPPVTDFMDGFVLGVDYYNEQNGTAVEVLGWDIEAQDGLFIGNFESTDDGRTTAESLMDEGADVIFPLAGAAGLGSGAAILDRGNAWMIGADTDWRVTAPEFADITLTSTLKRMDISLVDVGLLVATGTFEGGVYVGTLENGGVGITDGPYGLDLSEVTQMIIDGEIQTTP